MPERVLACVLTAALVFTGTGGAARAGERLAPYPAAQPDAEGKYSWDDGDFFQPTGLTVGFVSGYFPKARMGPQGPAIDYLPQALRLGLLCNEAHPGRLLHPGVFEVILEGEFSAIVRGPGNYFTGPNALLRYNLVLPRCPVVPYLQGGAGFVFNDAWKDQGQRVIGQNFEFLLRSELGVHVPISEGWSLDIEGGYQHISNACLAPRNGGLNCLGGSVGFTYIFRRP